LIICLSILYWKIFSNININDFSENFIFENNIYCNFYNNKLNKDSINTTNYNEKYYKYELNKDITICNNNNNILLLNSNLKYIPIMLTTERSKNYNSKLSEYIDYDIKFSKIQEIVNNIREEYH